MEHTQDGNETPEQHQEMALFAHDAIVQGAKLFGVTERHFYMACGMIQHQLSVLAAQNPEDTGIRYFTEGQNLAQKLLADGTWKVPSADELATATRAG